MKKNVLLWSRNFHASKDVSLVSLQLTNFISSCLLCAWKCSIKRIENKLWMDLLGARASTGCIWSITARISSITSDYLKLHKSVFKVLFCSNFSLKRWHKTALKSIEKHETVRHKRRSFTPKTIFLFKSSVPPSFYKDLYRLFEKHDFLIETTMLREIRSGLRETIPWMGLLLDGIKISS